PPLVLPNPSLHDALPILSRRRILRQIEQSLGRLRLERLPLYLAHAFDPEVPQEETLSAFDDLVRAGKIGAVGASNFSGDELAERSEEHTSELQSRVDLVC